ncbi:MAG: CocE/NonD family hydrolase [Erysipelotrichaceae bacterium]|nr:CocE/NonD family hydrolase [Erysipelotrichaceae bacterium]
MKKYTAWPGIIGYTPEDTEHFKTVKREINGKEVDIIFRKGTPGITYEVANQLRAEGKMVPDFSICPDLNPRTYIATSVAPHIICEQDLSMKTRDGVRLYFDLYRPANTTEPLPLIVCWAPFGKRPHEGQDGWKLMGVPPQTVSEMSKFEAADPGYWCRYGYAVANVDPRGVGHSEGDTVLWGEEDGKDGADFIDWAGEQSWCNGRVTLFGNSGVCMVIWRIAAEQPKHLACIGAWEGTGDMYRESLTYNGIPRPFFEGMIVGSCACSNYIEDNINMLIAHPFYDDFWKTKTPHWEKIKVPAYVCAGLCHFHLRGSCEGFRKIRSPKKWFRMHRDMEWPDTYNPDNMDDLRKFYDRYLKDVRNGWEFTPKVRVDVMDAYGFDYAHNQEEDNFPIPRTQYTKFYLDASKMGMSLEPVAEESEVVYNNYVEYNPDVQFEVTKDSGMINFDYKFNKDTEIIGYMKLHLWIECRGYDNMDMFFRIKKLGVDGEYLPLHCMKEPFTGAWGQGRGARRELDPKLSTDYCPVQAHQKDEPMEQGVVYPVDYEIQPTARIWHKGETLRLQISADFIVNEWYEDVRMAFVTDNGEKGEAKHVIHTGGQYDSYLQLPVIPPKYVAGDYVIDK